MIAGIGGNPYNTRRGKSLSWQGLGWMWAFKTFNTAVMFLAIALGGAAVVGGEAANEIAPISGYLTDAVAVIFGIVSGAATQVPRFEQNKITRMGLICELITSGLAGFMAHAVLLNGGLQDIRLVWAGAAVAGGLGATATKSIGQKFFPIAYPEDHVRDDQ